MDADTLASSGFMVHARGRLLMPEGVGTCKSSLGTFSCIDGFVAAEELSLAVRSIDVPQDAVHNPHVPVRIEFHPHMSRLLVLVPGRMPELPRQRLFGPIR
eukprot:11197269-Lingulodinium_polyedra.AAC.1